MKGTKFSRLLFQLVPKTHRTEEIGFGLLLKTPTASDWMTEKLKPGEGEIGSLSQQAVSGRLMKHIGMLPTPTASDKNSGRRGNAPRENHNPLTNSLKDAVNYMEETLKSSHLNPRFVAEMMGFPVNWTELPFQSGDKNQSKDTAMP
jgi:hypothetical protein